MSAHAADLDLIGPASPGRDVATIGVLIVDDDVLVAEVMAACCDEPDLDVVGIVHSADDALMAVASGAPDVALIDNRLGERSGVDLARDLLRIVPRLKVVIVTADPSPEVERSALDAGCSACIGKTMNIGSRLPEVIRQAHQPDDDLAVTPHPRG